MFPEASPLAVLSLIVAPAILTNASSVLIMSTSNRLARTVDRATELSRDLEADPHPEGREAKRALRELSTVERRSLMLLHALGGFYLALSGFAAAALLSLMGAVLEIWGVFGPARGLEVLGILAGTVAVSALVWGSILLVHETRLAVSVLRGKARHVRRQIQRSARPN